MPVLVLQTYKERQDLMFFEYVIDKVFVNPVFVITAAIVIAIKFICDAYVRVQRPYNDLDLEYTDPVAQRIRAISEDDDMLAQARKELIEKALEQK